jgi:hypothetical protein
VKNQILTGCPQKNANISAQGLHISDQRPVLETLINSTNNFTTLKWDLTTKYLSKKRSLEVENRV